MTCVAVRIEERELPLARAELEISSDLHELGRARAFVREVCRTLPGPALDEDGVSQLELAITEAASNVMRHAYDGRTDQRIQLDAEVFADRIVLRLHHLGETFDPGAVEDAGVRRHRGWRLRHVHHRPVRRRRAVLPRRAREKLHLSRQEPQDRLKSACGCGERAKRVEPPRVGVGPHGGEKAPAAAASERKRVEPPRVGVGPHAQ